MLIALTIAMLFGGGTVEIFDRDDFRAVSRVVQEAERADAVAESMERINSTLASVAEMRESIFEDLKAVDDLVGSRQPEYEALLERLWTARRNAHAEHIDNVFAMRSNMTREEWDQVFGSTAE